MIKFTDYKDIQSLKPKGAISPFIEIQSDMINPYFWRIFTRGSIAQALLWDRYGINKLKLKYKCYSDGLTIVYCTESQLDEFYNYLLSLGEENFKLVGLDLIRDDEVEHYIATTNFYRDFKKQISNYNLN